MKKIIVPLEAPYRIVFEAELRKQSIDFFCHEEIMGKQIFSPTDVVYVFSEENYAKALQVYDDVKEDSSSWKVILARLILLLVLALLMYSLFVNVRNL